MTRATLRPRIATAVVGETTGMGTEGVGIEVVDVAFGNEIGIVGWATPELIAASRARQVSNADGVGMVKRWSAFSYEQACSNLTRAFVKSPIFSKVSPSPVSAVTKPGEFSRAR